MTLQEGITIVESILNLQKNNEFVSINTTLGTLFDGVLIKPLKKRHIVAENIEDKGTRDSDIRFEREERHLFPYVENFRYEDDTQSKGHHKKWFLTQLFVHFSAENCDYLFSNLSDEFKKGRDTNFFASNPVKDEFVKVHLSKEKRKGERLSLGYKDIDDPAFYEFRKLLFELDYLIICKYRNVPRYFIFGAKENDLAKLNFKTKKSLVFLEEKAKTTHYTSFPITQRLKVETNKPIPHNQQWLISGAPGTGKSYLLKTEAQKYFKEENIQRITFHPNYAYGHFIGTFKPKQLPGQQIGYGFQLGILTKMLLKAIENPKENYVLIIEELNRGNANEILGDFIQVIERDEDGESIYQIEPNEDLSLYLEENYPHLPKKLYVPRNCYIWGTLNFGDKHTFPLDAAFLRRWDINHIGINEKENEISKYTVCLPNKDEPVLWNDVRKKLNEELMKIPFIKEDQLLGPFFAKKKEMSEDDFFYQVIVYLKENVLKDFATQFFTHHIISELKDRYKEGENIFRFEI
ncbi:AAA family ATPase [Bacillus sp. Brlt_9]|uniref:AAA family ATPase n=1 Tax=Bacillus sp. Brlt_9 TaxID=3110916 RepID=UPI003F7C6BB9